MEHRDPPSIPVPDEDASPQESESRQSLLDKPCRKETKSISGGERSLTAVPGIWKFEDARESHFDFGPKSVTQLFTDIVVVALDFLEFFLGVRMKGVGHRL
jgi:hypothetical protein